VYKKHIQGGYANIPLLSITGACAAAAHFVGTRPAKPSESPLHTRCARVEPPSPVSILTGTQKRKPHRGPCL